MHLIKVTILFAILINYSMSMSIGSVYQQAIDESGLKANPLPLADITVPNNDDFIFKKRSLMFNNEAALRLRNLLRRNNEYPLMKLNSNNVPIPQASFYGGMPIVF